ncbi:hypothetical protein KYB31_09310 [Clostridium felsineum]|uniref:hypothetical protein n=1 Tax=Clostridium felsineum TaxID=36839 RepID=UPI00214D1AE0|nr:hypothetical protein [Clostridium felsineum]MCR3759186.1 hypothetical protein [Clostridium felsineum]
MCKEIHFCQVCGQPFAEDHHIVFKSECKPMDKCSFNHVYLCYVHHRDHKRGVHHNKKLNNHYKMQVQAKLQELFTEEYYSMEQIQNKLQIGHNAVTSLCKLMKQHVGKYKTKEIIKACMGGRFYE